MPTSFGKSIVIAECAPASEENLFIATEDQRKEGEDVRVAKDDGSEPCREKYDLYGNGDGDEERCAYQHH
jgi:hypothetical protein